MNRCTMLQNLQSNKGIWDILIISSGATGLGIAVDAAIEVLKPCCWSMTLPRERPVDLQN